MFPTCFPLSQPRFPYKVWRWQPGLEVEESHINQETVQRSCLEALGQCRGAVWRNWWLIYNDSNRIQSLARCSQPGQPNPSTCLQQYPRRFLLKNGILHRRRADQRRGTLEQLVLPSSLRPDVPREDRDYINHCERCTVVPCFRKKKGDMILGMVVW